MAIKRAAKTVVQQRQDDRVTINCLYCGKAQQVGRRTMSIPCRYCHKTLQVEDVTLNGYDSRRAIETCGILTIGPKGNVIAPRVMCSHLLLQGKLKGNVTCRGPVIIESTGSLRGDLTTPKLIIAEGAQIQGNCQIGNG